MLTYAFKTFFEKNIWDLSKHIKKEKKNVVSSAHTQPFEQEKNINKMKHIIWVKKKNHTILNFSCFVNTVVIWIQITDKFLQAETHYRPLYAKDIKSVFLQLHEVNFYFKSGKCNRKRLWNKTFWVIQHTLVVLNRSYKIHDSLGKEKRMTE